VSKRLFISRNTVGEIELPALGEIWISDTKLRGFGVRIWRNPTGSIGGAYCIRTKDSLGKTRRWTFDVGRDHIPFSDVQAHFMYLDNPEDKSDQSFKLEFAYVAAPARAWARDALKRVKLGLPSISQEIKDQRRKIQQRVRKLTFETVAMSTLNNMQSQGISQAYFDRLDKLFHRFFSRNFLQKPMSDFEGYEVWEALRSSSISHGNFRLLMPFVRRVFSNYYYLAGGRNELDLAYDQSAWHPLSSNMTKMSKKGKL
jgi:hypothetical protein